MVHVLVQRIAKWRTICRASVSGGEILYKKAATVIAELCVYDVSFH